MQRFRAAGEPGEFGDWVVGLVHVPSDDDAGLRAALDEILTATAVMTAFAELPGDNASHYTLRMTPTGAWADAEHERGFWARAAARPELHADIARYVEQANAVPNGWQDEAHPPASWAVAELALADPRWCRTLGQLFFRWDMAHETWQENVVDRAFARHGFVDGTLDLLACRVCADGQMTDEQVASALHDRGLRDTIDLEDFARRCAKLEEQSIAGVDYGLDHLAQIYADGDKKKYDKAWAAFRRAGIKGESFSFDADESRERAARRTDYGDFGWDDAFTEASTDGFDPAALEAL